MIPPDGPAEWTCLGDVLLRLASALVLCFLSYDLGVAGSNNNCHISFHTERFGRLFATSLVVLGFHED